jgi:hypothetical protein
MKKLFLFASLILAVTALASADIYVKSQSHTDAMSFMGQTQPEKNEITEQWIGNDVFASVMAEQSFVVDLKKNILLMINHQNKSYIETTIPLDFGKLLPQEMAAMASMFKMSVTVNPTTEKKKIGQWDCTGYDMTMTVMMMPMKMKVWATTQVDFDMAKFLDMYANVMAAQMRLDDASLKEVKKIKGFLIASEMTGDIMGAKLRQTTEVVEISKKDAPSGIYSAPAGYTKKDKLSQDDLQRR